MNGKENLSPQDKNGVEVSDDPLRQCTKLKSSSCISLSLGAIGIISPFSRTSRSPCPLSNSIPASLQAAGKSCQSPVLCWGPAQDAGGQVGSASIQGKPWNPAQGVPWPMPFSRSILVSIDTSSHSSTQGFDSSMHREMCLSLQHSCTPKRSRWFLRCTVG